MMQRLMLLLMPVLAYGQTIIRVASIYETTDKYALDDSISQSSFHDGVNFLKLSLAEQSWVGNDGTEYTMELYGFDAGASGGDVATAKIEGEIKTLISENKDAAGNVLGGPYHAVIGATAANNKAIRKICQELMIPNVHASGGNPKDWWSHYAEYTVGGGKSYAYGMHLPFIQYTAPMIQAAAKENCKTAIVIRPWVSTAGNFHQVSSVAATQWVIDAGLEIIGPDKQWCDDYAAKYTKTCKLVNDGVSDQCRCIATVDGQAEVTALADANVEFDPTSVNTAYELDEKSVTSADGTVMADLSNSYVIQEMVDLYRGIYDNVRKQMQARDPPQDFVDTIVHFGIHYKSSLKALKEGNFNPKFVLGWNVQNVAGSVYFDATLDKDGNGDEIPGAYAGVTTIPALDWVDGLHAWQFGQWHHDLTYDDPLFGKKTNEIVATDWPRLMPKVGVDTGISFDYNYWGGAASAEVIYLAVRRNLFKADWDAAADIAAQRDLLNTAVANVQEMTLWGFVQFNMYGQNTGGGQTSTVGYQLQAQGLDWATTTTAQSANMIGLPEAAAKSPYVKTYATWTQRAGCSSLGVGNPFIVQASSPHPVCRSCDDYVVEEDLDAGVYMANDDSQKCILDVCPAGNYRFAPVAADVECRNCLTGQYSAVIDVDKCTDCARGTFAALMGSSTCDPCNSEKSTSAEDTSGQDVCVCKVGYHGASKADDWVKNGDDCIKCPLKDAAYPTSVDFTTYKENAQSVAECVCPAGSYHVVDDAGVARCETEFCVPGGFPEPLSDASEVHKMALVCQGHDRVDGVVTNLAPTLRPRYWVEDTAKLYGAVDNPIWSCLQGEEKDVDGNIIEFCKGEGNSADANFCGEHRIGTTCMWCDTDYRQETGEMKCEKCDSVSWFYFLGIPIIVTLTIVLTRPFWNKSILQQSSSIVVILTAISIIFFNIMAFSSLGSYPMNWVEPIPGLIRAAEFFQFDFNVIHMDCFIRQTDAIASYAIKTMVPLGGASFLAILTISNFLRQGKKVDWPVVINLMGMLFSFFFVAIAVLSFYPHRCGTLHPFKTANGKDATALDRQPDVVCSFDEKFADAYTPLIGLSSVALFLYVVLYLTFVIWAVYKHQSMVVGQHQWFIRSTRFLFFRWKNQCYYWTLFWHGRSFFVAFVPILNAGGAGGGELQMVLLIALMGAWLAQVSQTNPWRHPRLNVLDRCCTFMFVVLTLAASYTDAPGVKYFVMVVVVAFFAAVITFFSREVYLARTAATRPKADFFICHTQDSNAIVARAAKFTIEYHSGASVLMSIDGIEDYAQTVENARSCKQVIVLWTAQSAASINVALEVTSAVMNKRQMAVLEVDSLDETLSDERLSAVEQDWCQSAVEQFNVYLLDPAKITQAYSSLKFLQTVPYKASGSAETREASVLQLLQSVNAKTLKVPSLSTLPESVDLFIIHDTRNVYANAAAFVLKNAMRSLSFSIVTSSDYADEKFPSAQLGRCAHAVVLLHNGVLSSANFTASLLAIDEVCKVHTVSIGSEFAPPTNEQMTTMEKGNLECSIETVGTILKKGSPIDPKVVVGKYRELFRALTLPFSPPAVNGILNAEVGNILGRVKSGKRGTTMGSILLK